MLRSIFSRRISRFLARNCSFAKCTEVERKERINIQTDHVRKTLQSLDPIYTRPTKNIAENNRVHELTKELMNVKYEWIMSMAKSALCTLPDDPTKRMHALRNFEKQQACKETDLKNKMIMLFDTIKEESIQMQPWRYTQAPLNAFKNA
ncbi:uncharacterized protein LOC113375901 [Ctenocephalides felis]|uniref:uncharacterized protein LOC113375901 n=1 Tax=Ctenocephalides felis TaxID=7515 RepID=UPI000E6E2373|nr:uncharacterized protein LOC113375901 [Ctenocephalides felis]